MASIAVTTAWSDPSANLPADQTYIVQNRATQAIQFFEGATFDATTNANDGVILVPLSDGGSGANSMHWSYDSTNMVRVRMVAAPVGGSAANLLEFALAS